MKETESEKKIRIFNHCKERLIKESQQVYTLHNGNIRFIVIEYLCKHSKIDPYRMAKSLKNDGYLIIFDDSSISKLENKIKYKKVHG